MSDYPDYGPPSGRPGYGSSYQATGAAVSNICEEALLVSISGRGVFLGCFIEIDGPDDELDYGVRIKIDGNTYYYNNIEDIFMLHTSFGGGPGPKMTYYSPEDGKYCFSLFVVSSFSESVQIYGENGAGVATIFASDVYYSLVEES